MDLDAAHSQIMRRLKALEEEVFGNKAADAPKGDSGDAARVSHQAEEGQAPEDQQRELLRARRLREERELRRAQASDESAARDTAANLDE